MIWLSLLLSLAIILLSCELFTNGVEWLGKKLNFGDGVVGSIFSAVGTCLPETMIPIIAIISSVINKNSQSAENLNELGIGAILGAPFMLSTLAFFITGLSALIFWRRRKAGFKMLVDIEVISRDLSFFLVVYLIGVGISFIGIRPVRVFTALSLLSFYIYYIYLTVKDSTANHNDVEELYLARAVKAKPEMAFIIFQVLFALAGIIIGAKLFVSKIEALSGIIGISTGVLALIITPIATELPEKFNSIIWVSKKKDTLAMGNITGAMVFQSCIPVSIGILWTTWKLDGVAACSAALALSSACFTILLMKKNKKLTPLPLLFGGAFYALFIIYTFILSGL